MSKKLLLADDSITIQKVIGITFANEEYDLEIVDNGETALEKIRSERPDLVLSDVFMPGKNGYELTAAVKQDPALRTVPVLLLAGTFEPFDEDKARAAGADDWISKPFESQALLDKVDEMLAKASSGPAVEAIDAPAVAPAVPSAAEPAAAEPVMSAAASVDDAAAQWGETVDFDLDDAPADDDLWDSVSFAEEDLGSDLEFEEFSEEAPAFSAVAAATEAAAENEFFFPDEPLSDAGQEISADEEFAAEAGEPFSLDASLASGDETESWDFAVEEDESFVFGADPLAADAEAPTAATGVDAFAEWEEPVAEELSAWEEEEDILTLDEADILEEEDLQELPAAEPAADELPSAEEIAPPSTAEEAFAEAATAPLAEAIEEEDDEDDWDFADSDFAEETSLPEREAPPEPPAAAPAAQVAAESVTRQVQNLSEEDLAHLVEKVAGAVVERLAAAVVEKIAWEVVPDLAESMIREELHSLKAQG